MKHNSLGLGDIHRLANWEYATATARLAATGFTADDIGKIAKQVDNNTLWELTAVPAAWLQIGGSSNIQFNITIASEDADSIEIAIQVQDSSGNNLSRVYAFDAWLSDNATEKSITTTAPDGGFYAGSANEIFEYVTDIMKKFITDSNGAISILVDETGAEIWYLCIQMPDGTLTVSDAITFA